MLYAISGSVMHRERLTTTVSVRPKTDVLGEFEAR